MLKIKLEPIVLSPTSQKPPENFDFNVYCSLTDDEKPTKPQRKLIGSSKENSWKKVSKVVSSSHNISLANASSTSQTTKVSKNLSLISSTPIKTTIDINNVNDESSTLHLMNCIEIEILFYVQFAMTLKYYYSVSQKNFSLIFHFGKILMTIEH